MRPRATSLMPQNAGVSARVTSLAFAGLILTACTVPPPAPTEPPSHPGPERTTLASPAPSARLDATPAEPPPAPRGEASVGAAARITPPRAAPKPEMLTGLSDAEVIRLLGRPGFRRTEDPSAIWRYRGAGCVLDLYLRAAGPLYRVVHYELRRDPAARARAAPFDPDACFARLAAPRADRRG